MLGSLGAHSGAWSQGLVAAEQADEPDEVRDGWRCGRRMMLTKSALHRSRSARRFSIALVLALFAFGPRDAAAECIVVFESDPVVRLKSSRFVYLAQVTAADPEHGTATARVVRSWKGSKRTFSWHGAGGVRVGDYYLVFGEADPEVFPYECGNRPLPLAGVHREVTLLNRYRGYPRLVVPAPKAKGSS